MRKTFGKLAGAVALAAIAVTGAAAQDAPRGKKAGDFVVGLGGIAVLPSNGGNTSIGGKPEASNSGTAQLDFTYFMLPQVALNLIAATSQHDVSVKGSALGDVKLGSVWVLPPTLTLQIHPLPALADQPLCRHRPELHRLLWLWRQQDRAGHPGADRQPPRPSPPWSAWTTSWRRTGC